MIDFSKYNLTEMQAIVTVLDDLTDEMSIVQSYEEDFHIALAEYMRASVRATALINQQAEAEKVNRIKDACIAGAPPAEAPTVPQVDMKELEYLEQAAPPDMFGWAGDALDDLCAAEEVLGSDE